ncbi:MULTISPECIES: major capsid protein [unclassified Duganella]|uniref:major capsid protein n=2 Tax=Oxalobacteraceae TaxID=75682 RepID=UPI000891D5D7|nr:MULTISPECIES: major capsid protein [unclassified Duganella]SDH05908.1 Phage major capsid protein E [Duganella sp. OV458]SDK20179.1 Phage major capsid protein E [Duganella sp. OV510]
MSLNTNFVFDTNTLIAVVPNLKRPQKFLLDRFFPNVEMSDSEYVSIDVDVGKRRMSPFVSPLVGGKLVESRRTQTNMFKPAYIKDKRAPDLRKPVRRAIGEQIGGSLTGAEREAANLELELTDQLDMLDRRLEWMAASALINGTVTITGEGFPTVVVDFGRDASLTVAKSGTGRWIKANIDAGTASPTNDVSAWAQQMLKKSGAAPTDIVFSTSAWNGFKLDPALQGAIVYPKLSDSGNAINPAAMIKPGAQYQGRWGQYDLWVYNDWYVDDNNVEQPMIPDGALIMTGGELQGTRAFGQVLDPEHNYQALPYAPKTWVEKDPAQRLLLLQSSPIVIPARANACMSAQVI